MRRGESVNSWETQRQHKDGRILDVWVTATALKDGMGRPVAIALTVRDVTNSKQAEEALQQLNESLEKEVADRTRTLSEREARLSAILNSAADVIITIDTKGIIQSANSASARLFGYSATELLGQNVTILVPSPYPEVHDGYLANYAGTWIKKMIGISREAVAQRKDGSTFPVEVTVSEVDHQKLFMGILRDISRRKELEREVVEIASLEQRRIGQDLHDSVGQDLTALNILGGDLAEALRTDPSDASNLVEQMVQGLKRCQKEIRAVLRGLLPVAVDADGLMSALSDLADRIQQEGKVICTFDCPEPVSVADNLSATHLYLIAQEAVHNALKHGRPRHIRIGLESNNLLLLSVQDDGIGLPTEVTENHGVLGLRIMRNRAAIIGATLAIQAAERTGTLVTCALPRKNNETRPDQEPHQDSDRR